MRGGSCGVIIWGGCVDDSAAAVAAVEDWLLLLLLFDGLAVAEVPEPDAAPDTDTDAAAAGADDDAVDGLSAAGVFALPLPLEEASRWSSALSASAL